MRIIYIDIDSARPDHLGCYEYPRTTTPVLDGVASQSTIFTNCHGSDTPGLPSRTALFSGRFGIHNGVTGNAGPADRWRATGAGQPADPAPPIMWMRYLQVQGWQTVCCSGLGPPHQTGLLAAGFTQDLGNQLAGADAAEVTGKAVAWLNRHGAEDNWFLYVGYRDVHPPYEAPEAYVARLRGQPTLEHPTAEELAADARDWYGPRTARDWWCENPPRFTNPEGPRTLRMPAGNPGDSYASYLAFVDAYDAGLAYVDEQVGRLLTALDQLKVRAETALIISGDHGASIGELGQYFAPGNCCEGTTRVPLIVCWPGVTDSGWFYDGLLYQLDLAPTVLELLQLPVPAHWDGLSHAAAVRGDPMHARTALVLGTGAGCYQRAVRTNEYRLIRTLHPGLYPYDPVYLFDMQEDPAQRTNLAARQPTVVAELDQVLREFVRQYTTGPEAGTDPLQAQLAAGVAPETCCSRQVIEQRLINLGRQDQLADLRRRESQPTSTRPQ